MSIENFIERFSMDLILFSFIEVYIHCLFYKKFYKIENIEIDLFISLSILYSLIGVLFPPIIYQIFIILLLWIFICGKKHEIKIINIFLAIYSMIFLLINEMIFFLFYETLFGIDFSNCNEFYLFLYMIPIRIFEILLILGGDKMKAWAGEIKRK